MSAKRGFKKEFDRPNSGDMSLHPVDRIPPQNIDAEMAVIVLQELAKRFRVVLDSL